MKVDNKIYWIVGGAIVTAGTIYLLMKKKTPKTDIYGNSIIKSKVSAIKGGIKTATSGSTISEPNWNDPFDQNYYKDVKKWVNPKKIIVLPTKEGEEMAKAIHKAKSKLWLIGDHDEKAVSDIFSKKLRDKIQVANLSHIFWDEFKIDMWDYLTTFLDKDEMEKYVHRPVRNLKNYRLAKN